MSGQTTKYKYNPFNLISCVTKIQYIALIESTKIISRKRTLEWVWYKLCCSLHAINSCREATQLQQLAVKCDISIDENIWD